MKKIVFVFAVFVFAVITSCNNNDKKQVNDQPALKAQADSLEKEVDEEHIIAMRKSMTIPDLQKEISRLIDSIGKLPAKAQVAAASYKAKLDGLNKELADASTSMENWMAGFGERLRELNDESMNDSLEQRVKFFAEEKIKVNKVKEAVLGSIEKADALLKEKF